MSGLIEDGFLSEAVQWWEEWQLRVLVLASLFLQYFLYIAAICRRFCIPPWFRFMIWLAYLGSDAVAIYALAALFNRHKQEWISTHRDDASLEALWAPIMLVHLGGVDSITAYNIEDNELWRRHVLTAVSQVAVAIYVFQKSWSGDKKLLGAAILIFVAGIVKCIEKPVALKRASIGSLMSIRDDRVQTQPNTTGFYIFTDMITDRTPDRYTNHDELRKALHSSFGRLYTKGETTSHGFVMDLLFRERKLRFGTLLRLAVNPMIFTALGLFHMSHREAYNSVDVKVTYTLLSCTAVFEYFAPLLVIFIVGCLSVASDSIDELTEWPDQIAHYNLIGYLARDRKHWIRMMIMGFLGCKEYLDQLWCMKPYKRSRDITRLVQEYIRVWKDRSRAADSRAFNDNRGHWILKSEGFGGSKILRGSLRRPFDESVLLWHLATEFCYLERREDTVGDAIHHSRVISNYMAYLLFTNPEMLMTGARPRLFTAAYEELKGIVPLENEGEPMQKKPALREEELTKKIIQKLKSGSMQGGGIALDAWTLYKDLIDLCKGNDEKMWRVIEGVWVEMLCFSASRCRGYLHAKSLGKGGEYLSYIWLLLLSMGVETLAQKMQRTEVPEQEDDGGDAACTTSATTPATVVTGIENERNEIHEEGGSNGAGADCITLAAPVTTITGDDNEKVELQEEGDNSDGADCTAPAMTITGDEDNGGSQRTTSATPATTAIGDENV
ncbi:unnamed protein product [Urochloa humidicola]